MLPYLTIFGRQLPTYGLLAALGVLLALLYLKLRTRSLPGPEEADYQLAFLFAGLGAAVGAKLLYLLTVLPELIRDLPLLGEEPLTFLHTYLSGGFVFYGGLYGALAGLWLYGRVSRGKSMDAYLNRLFPCFPLVHALGRVGCFCAGCCYGRVTDSALGVAFHLSPNAPNGIPLLPVQLFGAGFELALFALCAGLARRGVGGRRLLGLYLLLYAPARFLLEFFRGDAARGFVGALSVSQLISIPTALLGLWLLWRGRQTKDAARPL